MLKLFSFPWTYAPHPQWSKEQLEQMDQFAGELDKRFKALSKEADAIRANRDFTAEGRTKRLAELTMKAEAWILEPLAIPAKEITQQLTALERAMNDKHKGPAQMNATELLARAARQMVSEIRHAEIRAHVRSLGKLEGDVFYKIAVLDGDIETAEALETAPRSLRVLSSEVVEELFDKRQMQRFPDEWKQFHALKLLNDEMQSGVKAALGQLKQHGISVSTFDPIARVLEKQAA